MPAATLLREVLCFIETVHQCNCCLGCKTLHPLVSVIDLSKSNLEQQIIKFDFYTGVMKNYQKMSVAQDARVELHDSLALTGAEVSINHLPAGAGVPFVHSHKHRFNPH